MKPRGHAALVQHLVFLLMLGTGAAIVAGESEGGIPTSGPVPRTIPQVPGRGDTANPEQQLLLRLTQQVEAHDRRILELGQRVPAAARPTVSNDPALDKPRRDRNLALTELLRAIEAFGGHHPERGDVLDVSRPAIKTVQAGPIAAANHVRVAECYQELVQSGGGNGEDLEAGAKTLLHCDPKTLPASEQPRWWYLRVWFAAERARRATDETRATMLAEAQEAQRTMSASFPGLELTVAAQSLTLDIGREVRPIPQSVAP